LVAQSTYQELLQYDPKLAAKPRWLILNKIDLLPKASLAQHCQDLIDRLHWEGPVFRVSAIAKQGVDAFCHPVMAYMESHGVALGKNF